MKGIIRNFKSTTLLNAFILNSLAVAMSTTSALYIKTKYFKNDSHLEFLSTFAITLIVCIVTLLFLNFLFGFGRGMLAVPLNIPK